MEEPWVGLDRRKLRSDGQLDVSRVPAERRVESRGFDRVLEDGTNVDRRDLDDRRPREIEEVADEPLQAVALLLEDVEEVAAVLAVLVEAAKARDRVEDRAERIADLVRHHRGHLTDGGESLLVHE